MRGTAGATASTGAATGRGGGEPLRTLSIESKLQTGSVGRKNSWQNPKYLKTIDKIFENKKTSASLLFFEIERCEIS